MTAIGDKADLRIAENRDSTWPLSANSGRCRRTAIMLSSGHATEDGISLLKWDAPLNNEKLVNQAGLGQTAQPESKPSQEDEHL